MAEVPPPAPIQVGGYGPAGGYKFEANEVDSVIKQWQDLLDDLNTDLKQARTIAEVRRPADEPASNDFIDKGANPSGTTLLEQHQRMVQYVNNFITALKAAKNKITVAEQEARDSASQAG
ncbi:hypothetical protein [Amycolatopsis sp. PS_44_ISF1]|uniref:hypothetical protein n=1 Tax=Amycolatopsis sp. PS_44_ISF1 TaxID=2974917 RepID=UPI0028DF880F|nr:hypothetical protein [Amycolatopsis sp. PS_44_ISF1]MDT8910491.1 hypothetical protein [Amycolatopsis sp. PS_44_ISF1]